MGGIEIWLIGLSLAMDCFAISIVTGVILHSWRWGIMMRTALAFGVFQMMMTLLGWAVASSFSGLIENVDHWIAFGLLLFLGIRMILESFKKKEERTLDPTNWKILIVEAIATSIDAAAVGISFAFVGLKSCGSSIIVASAVIGFVSFAMTWVGLFGGIRFGKSFAEKIHAEMWGGIILIAIGTKILIEHLSTY
jgi:putative Mn2+ efflux pump MntP